MELTPAAIMKTVKRLEQQRVMLLQEESDNSSYDISDTQTVTPPPYSFEQMRDAIHALDEKVFALKSALNRDNALCVIEGAGKTPSELLLIIAQMNRELERITELAKRPQKKQIPVRYLRGDYNSINIYHVANYDVEAAKASQFSLQKQISELQMQLDTHNLTHMIEVDVEL